MRQGGLDSEPARYHLKILMDRFEIGDMVEETPALVIFDKPVLRPEMDVTPQALFIHPLADELVKIVNMAQMPGRPRSVFLIPSALLEKIPC